MIYDFPTVKPVNIEEWHLAYAWWPTRIDENRVIWLQPCWRKWIVDDEGNWAGGYRGHYEYSLTDPNDDYELLQAGWYRIGDGTPINAWLDTKRLGEDGHNTCMARIMEIGGDVEWIERMTGVTTVTHGSFAPPTHWRWPEAQRKASFAA